METTTTRLGEVADAASETMKETADHLRDELDTTQRRVRELVEEYPLTCFFGAVVAGYVIGRIATRF